MRPELRYRALVTDHSTPAYKRVCSGGFKINSALRMLRNDALVDCVCVCGKQEILSISLVDIVRYLTSTVKVDVGQIIEDRGINSVEHLQGDGYTDEEIKNIRKAYNSL